MKDYKITYMHKGTVKTYRAKGQQSEQLALAAWRFYCIKNRLWGSELVAVLSSARTDKVLGSARTDKVLGSARTDKVLGSARTDKVLGSARGDKRKGSSRTGSAVLRDGANLRDKNVQLLTAY